MSFRAHLRSEVLGGTGRVTGLKDQWSTAGAGAFADAAPPDSAAAAPIVASAADARMALMSNTDVGFAGFMS